MKREISPRITITTPIAINIPATSPLKPAPQEPPGISPMIAPMKPAAVSIKAPAPSEKSALMISKIASTVTPNGLSVAIFLFHQT